MGILNTNFIKKFITNNPIEKIDDKGENYTDYDAVKYRWSHGSTESYLGDGLIIYSLINFLNIKLTLVGMQILYRSHYQLILCYARKYV